MDKPKLKIKPKKYHDETTIVSMRIPKDMVRDIDRIAEQTGRSRNELLSMFIEFSLDHIEIIAGKDTE